MKRGAFIMTAIAATLAAGAACAEDAPTEACTTVHPVVFFRTLDDLPAPIRADFMNRAGVGEPPAATPATADKGGVQEIVVESDARTFRLLRVGKSGDTWFIWYELGGLGVSMHEVFYGLGVSGMTHEPTAFRWGGFVSWNPCLATDAFLDGVWPENAGR